MGLAARLRNRKRVKKPFWRELLESLALAFVCYLLINNYAVQAREIPSGSMEPTLLVGDRLMVSRSSYTFDLIPEAVRMGMLTVDIPFGPVTLAKLSDPKRGDIVVFRHPENPGLPDFIKRVIGLPGESVEVRGTDVIINGEKIADPWARFTGGQAGRRQAFGPVKVPPGHYFVMGDNRDHSYDSRFWRGGRGGFVPRRDIVGKALFIYWSSTPQGGQVRWARIGEGLGR